MPRRLGATVPQTVSRLLQGGVLPQPPAWFTAVSTVAPVRPSLVKRIPKQDPDSQPSTSNSSSSSSSSSSSTSTSTSSSQYAWKGPRKMTSKRLKRQLKYKPAKPTPIKGLELQDKLRRTFYEEHPFEAFRGINLVEQDVVLAEKGKPGPQGIEWTELRQRSCNPSPEDCIDFVINLHKSHEIPLALAYSSGLSQYHALKASHEIAVYSAQQELQANGFTWPTEFSSIDRLTRAEDKNILDSIREAAKMSANDPTASMGAPRIGLLDPLAGQARASVGSSSNPKLWTGGLQYLTGKESPAVTSALSSSTSSTPLGLASSNSSGGGGAVKGFGNLLSQNRQNTSFSGRGGATKDTFGLLDGLSRSGKENVQN